MILLRILLVLLFTWFMLFLKRYIQARRNQMMMYEGLDNPPTYTVPPSNTTDPLTLANLNASNISYLKSNVDNLMAMKQEVDTLSSKVDTLTTTVQGLSTQLSGNAKKQTGCDPADTGSCPLNSIAANSTN